MPALAGLTFKNVFQRFGEQCVQLIADDIDDDVLLKSFTLDRLMPLRRFIATVKLGDRPPAKAIAINLSLG